MKDLDELRIQVLNLESRVNDLAVQVIRGRTEMAEKVDTMAATVHAIDAKVDGLAGRLGTVQAVLIDMPKLIVRAIADAGRKGARIAAVAALVLATLAGGAARASDGNYYDSRERDAYSAQLCMDTTMRKNTLANIAEEQALTRKYGALNVKLMNYYKGLLSAMDHEIAASRSWLRSHGGALSCQDEDVKALIDCFWETYEQDGGCSTEAKERCDWQNIDEPVVSCAW